MVRIFTYGSLKKGFHNHHMIGKDAQFIQDDTVKGKLYSAWSYPLLYKGDDIVHGEIYDISIEAFLHIMEMELESGYALEKVYTGKGQYIYVFYYVRDTRALVDDSRYIPSGVWELPKH